MKSKSLEFDEISFLERVTKTSPHYVHALTILAEAYTQKGFYQKGLEVDKRLAKLCPQDPTVHYNLACSYALMGDKEEALMALDRAIRFGYCDFGHLKKDQDLRSLHEDPRFKALTARKNKPRQKN